MRVANRRCRGFSLTEMLVVLGIILVLMGILIPVVIGVKRQSRKVACAARLRVIGQALQIYLSENDDVIPQGCMSNSLDSPQSRVGCARYDIFSYAMRGGFLPIPPMGPTNEVVKFVGPPGFALPLAPIAYFMGKGAPVKEQIWSCPAMRNGQPGSFRTYQYVLAGRLQSDPSFLDSRSGPLAGERMGIEEYKPGYQFMSGAEFWFSIVSGKDEVNRKKYHYDQFATRNIAGLRLSEMKPEGGQAPGQVVTFADYSVMAHSKETEDMWQPDLWKRMGNYSANFLYLDGHVDYHEFKSVGDYFKVLHRPISQIWGSGRIQNVLSAPDVWNP